MNTSLVEALERADKVVICGEALSHCVNYTVRDLVAVWPHDRRQDLVLLTDCSSAVPGFEAAGEVRTFYVSSDVLLATSRVTRVES